MGSISCSVNAGFYGEALFVVLEDQAEIVTDSRPPDPAGTPPRHLHHPGHACQFEPGGLAPGTGPPAHRLHPLLPGEWAAGQWRSIDPSMAANSSGGRSGASKSLPAPLAPAASAPLWQLAGTFRAPQWNLTQIGADRSTPAGHHRHRCPHRSIRQRRSVRPSRAGGFVSRPGWRPRWRPQLLVVRPLERHHPASRYRRSRHAHPGQCAGKYHRRGARRGVDRLRQPGAQPGQPGLLPGLPAIHACPVSRSAAIPSPTETRHAARMCSTTPGAARRSKAAGQTPSDRLCRR